MQHKKENLSFCESQINKSYEGAPGWLNRLSGCLQLRS